MGAGLASHHLRKTARSNYSCDCGRQKCVARECGSVRYPKPGPRMIRGVLWWHPAEISFIGSPVHFGITQLGSGQPKPP